MLPTKGLFTDCKPIHQPKDTHRDARNIVLSKIYGTIINEPGFEVTAVGYPDTLATSIGTIVFPDNSYAVLSDGINGGKDRIGFVDINDNYIDLIVDDTLGLDINFPIRSSEIDYNYLKQRIISWTDFNKPPRILNIDNIPFALDGSKALVDPTQIIELEVFTKFRVPQITFQTSDSSGAVKVGNYSFAVAYENIDGTRTTNSIPQGNINITDDSTSDVFSKIDGGIPGSLTSKSIQLTINNVDQRYNRLVLIGISRINNQVLAFEIKKVDINSSTIIITYIGTEITVGLSLEDVLRVSPLYTKSKAMAQLNNVLYHTNLEAEDDIDYQSYANNIRIFYNTKLVSITDINNSHKNNMPGGFAHGGIYAFYIRLLLKNGSTSRAFHIPGRATYGGETNASTSATTEGFVGVKVYQFEDTTNQASHTYSLDGDTNRVTSMASSTNMGYWENQNELYPNNFASGPPPLNLAGQKVRHHVFPTIQKCSQTHYSTDTAYGNSKLDTLGIDVVDVVIPPAIADQVEGWQILYAKRGYENSNTLGTDILLFGHFVDGNTTIQWSAGGNWRTDTRNSGGSAGNQMQPHDANIGGHPTTFIRGHNFELMKDKPQLSSANLYFDLEVKLRKDLLDGLFDNSRVGEPPSTVSNGEAAGNMVGSGTASGQNPGAVIDYTYSINVSTTLLASQVSKKLIDFRYLPSGIIDGLRRTIKNEEAFQVQVPIPITPALTTTYINISTPSRAKIYLFDGSAGYGSGSSTYEETYLVTYKQIKANVYANFDQQLLVATDTIFYKSSGVFPTQATKIRGGDHFISTRGFVTTSPFYDGDYGGTNIVTITRVHLTESRYNIGLRYEVQGDITTRYYPKSDPFLLWTNPNAPQQDGVNRTFDIRSPNINNYGYSNDSNAINDLYQSIIANPSQITTNKFPFRVIRSGFAGTNPQSIRSWKTYLIADKYEANRNKGEIENIAVMDDILLIHHLHGLFRTTGKDKLLLDTTEIFLGTGDIFQQQPKEMIPSKIGYLGTQNIFSCISFKGGYCWQNQQEGKCYLITSNNIEEISNNGMINHFKDNLKIDNTLPNNPFLGTGLITGFDGINNRILFTKRGTNPFTLSYSIDYKMWACFHDYLPDYYFFNNNMMFAISGHKIYKCHSITKKATYFDSTIYPSYIDMIFKDTNIEIDNLYENINWISEVRNQANTIQRNLTLTHIKGTTDYQDTGEIALVPFSGFGVSHNTRALINHWYFNKLKDSNSDVYIKRPISGPYALIRFKYDNHANLDLSQNSLYLYSFDAKFRKVEL